MSQQLCSIPKCRLDFHDDCSHRRPERQGFHSRQTSRSTVLSQAPFRYVSDTCRPASYRQGYRCFQWIFVFTVEQVFHKSPIAVLRIRSFPAQIAKDDVRLQPRRRRALANVASIARPLVVPRFGHYPHSHRIEMPRRLSEKESAGPMNRWLPGVSRETIIRPLDGPINSSCPWRVG